MIRAWRLVKSRLAATAFDGEGARLHGARWNSPGVPVAYASESEALAILEVLAHLQGAATLEAYSMVSVRFPDELVEDLEASALPTHWYRFPAPSETRALGDQWVRDSRSAILRVPSAILPSSYNYLVNPAHSERTKVIVETPKRFELDPRLLKGDR